LSCTYVLNCNRGTNKPSDDDDDDDDDFKAPNSKMFIDRGHRPLLDPSPMGRWKPFPILYPHSAPTALNLLLSTLALPLDPPLTVLVGWA